MTSHETETLDLPLTDGGATEADRRSADRNWMRTGPRDAETVLLIHPVGLDLTYWDKQIAALSATYDIVAFDLPGHGLSAAPPAGWSFEKAAADVAELMEQLGVGTAHVVGLSLGGMIALELALSHPARVRSLTLIGTAATFSDEARSLMRAHGEAVRAGGMQAVLASLKSWLAAETIERRPDLIDRVSKTLLQGDADVYSTMWEMIAAFDTLNRLGDVQSPTLVLVGSADLNTPPASAQELSGAIREATSIVLEGGGHLLPLDLPEAVNEHILEFIRSVDDADRVA